MTWSMTTLAKDAAIAGLAGYVATRVMEPVSQKLRPGGAESWVSFAARCERELATVVDGREIQLAGWVDELGRPRRAHRPPYVLRKP